MERELVVTFEPEMSLVEVFRFRGGEVIKTGSFCCYAPDRPVVWEM